MDSTDKVKNKKLFFFFLLVYSIGLVVLFRIGDSINENGLIISAFIAPVLSLIGVIGMAASLYFQKDKTERKK